MKPNDKAYEAARSAILKAIAERNCIIAGVPFNENNTDEFDAGEAVEHAKVAVDAAYAAQLQSDDYAELIRALRSSSPYTLSHVAADALEAVVAERDALKAELAKAQEIARVQAERIGGYIKTIEDRDAERDALLARLAPVEDEELVEIAAKVLQGGYELEWSVLPEEWKKDWRRDARNVIAAIRPHIEAAERERCAAALEITSDEIRLHAGEMTAQEMRSVLAVLAWRAAAIRSGK